MLPLAKLIQTYPANASVRQIWEPKPNGDRRKIAAPSPELLAWLQTVNETLNTAYSDWLPIMHGGIRVRSYVSYAKPHVGHPCVITVDIKSCFDSINVRQVAARLSEVMSLEEGVARQLANKLCYKGFVAQGFPTSNFICNLCLLKPLDTLNDHFSAQGLVLTNYVDDIAVSGNIGNSGEVINVIATELSRAGFAINKSRNKVKVMPASGRQVICGLQVNTRLTVTKDKKAELLSAVTNGLISEASLNGWVANLKNVDPAFANKLKALATKKGFQVI